MPVPISEFMTRETKTIQPSTSVGEAYALMRKNRIRHLPVIAGGKVVGILSHRDLLKIEALANIDRSKDPVSDAMTIDPYIVPPEEPLVSVVSVMALRKLGSAVIVESGKVAGIFTTTDALHAFAMMLRSSQDREQKTVLSPTLVS